MEELDSTPKSAKKSRKHLPIARIIVALVIVALAGLAAYFYIEMKDAKNNPEKASQQQVESLVAKVGKLITLPSDEQPTVATVQDKEKLKEQPFFSGAENGDKLLIYTKAQKAIIYRESTNTLINVGPVTLDTAEAATQAEKQ